MNTYLKFTFKKFVSCSKPCESHVLFPTYYSTLKYQTLDIKMGLEQVFYNDWSLFLFSFKVQIEESLSHFWFHSLRPQEGTCCLLQIKHTKNSIWKKFKTYFQVVFLCRKSVMTKCKSIVPTYHTNQQNSLAMTTGLKVESVKDGAKRIERWLYLKRKNI